MGKAPDVIIITRHGARLDAENRNWHKTAEAPYDTPLSYGGWTQTRALGARIASILHARSTTLDEDDNQRPRSSGNTLSRPLGPLEKPDSPRPAKRRKHKIMIHSSPYLRCVQSAIGISAGISQYEGNLVRFESQEIKRPTTPKPLYTPMRSKTLDTSVLEAKYRHGHRSKSPKVSGEDLLGSSSKPTLRVDAYLGEWQNPEYYQGITKPPDSSMMVAGAKLELRRPAVSIQGSNLHETQPSRASIIAEAASERTKDLKPSSLSLQTLVQTLTELDTEATLVTTNPEQIPRPISPSPARSHSPRPIGYFPPIPNYAVSTSESIPNGYVAHARDACLDLDLQWDSMREPQLWGDGGTYGEEWSAMHNRFRKGLMETLTWYKMYGPRSVLDLDEEDTGNEEYDDLVLVLVTHSAGCNAIIGALTDRPVLIDFGMGSLTMATLKDPTSKPRRTSSSDPLSPRRRRSIVDVSQADPYEMQITASVDHLRAGSDLLKMHQLQSPLSPSSHADTSRRNRGISLSAASSPLSTTFEIDRPRSKNSSLGSIRRFRPSPSGSGSNFPGVHDLAPPTDGGPSHLWDPRRSSTQSVNSIQEQEEGAEHNVDPRSPRQAHIYDRERERESSPIHQWPSIYPDRRGAQHINQINNAAQAANGSVEEVLMSPVEERESVNRRPSQRGLWNSAEKVETVNKRRWTITDR